MMSTLGAPRRTQAGGDSDCRADTGHGRRAAPPPPAGAYGSPVPARRSSASGARSPPPSASASSCDRYDVRFRRSSVLENGDIKTQKGKLLVYRFCYIPGSSVLEPDLNLAWSKAQPVG